MACVYARSHIGGVNGYRTVPPFFFSNVSIFTAGFWNVNHFLLRGFDEAKTDHFNIYFLEKHTARVTCKIQIEYIQHKCDNKNEKFDRNVSTSALPEQKSSEYLSYTAWQLLSSHSQFSPWMSPQSPEGSTS